MGDEAAHRSHCGNSAAGLQIGVLARMGPVWLPVALLAAPACGSDAPAVEWALVEAYRIQCGKIQQCCNTEEAQALQAPSFCETLAQPGQDEPALLPDHVLAALAEGRVRYDGAAHQHCLDDLAGLSCAETMGRANPCERFLVPEVPVGGGCRRSYECHAGYCVGARRSADGVCQPLLLDGQICSGDEMCADNLCVAQTGTYRCRNPRQRPRAFCAAELRNPQR